MHAKADCSAYTQKVIAAAAMATIARELEDAEAQVILMDLKPVPPVGVQVPAVAVRSLTLVPVQAESE